jgi:putative nucleotidyltransferase with HDIG domain
VQATDDKPGRSVFLGRESDSAEELSSRILQWKYLPQTVMAVLLVLLFTFMFPQGKSFKFADLKEGDVYVGEEIIAPFTFSVNKTASEYEADVKVAREKVEPVFVRVDSIAQKQLRRLEYFFVSLDSIRMSPRADSVKIGLVRDLLNRNGIVASDSELFLLISRPGAQDRKGSRSRQSTSAKGLDLSRLSSDLIRVARDLYAIGILEKRPSELPGYVQRINVGNTSHDLTEFYGPESVQRDALEKLRQLYPDDEDRVRIGYQILVPFLEPNIIYNESETQRRIKEAIARVPLAKGTVLEKERIIASNERITKAHIEKLRSLADEMVRRESGEGALRAALPYLGRFLIVLSALSILGVFLYLGRREVFDDPKRVLMIAILLALVVIIAYLVNRAGLSEFLIPVTIASMLLTIFFDTRIGLLGTVSLGLLIGAMRGNEYSITMVSIFVGMVAIVSVSRVRSRVWLFKALVSISVGYFFAIAAIDFVRHAPFGQVAEHWFYGMLNGLLSPILTYGLMVVFEYIFDITTDATLLELSDLNKPLLRKLAMIAPGTYHHSIIVGNLAETAAEKIGANSLLTRVGAYYHDIGKMEMPEYFVENQKGGRNPHDRLAPSMSALILINHVKRGLEIAEQHGLPKEIRDFIAQHHGSSLIAFFYEKARERSNGSEVEETTFRYPGPRPTSKETGIVMLADSVEAAARTLKDPSVGRLRSMVNGIIQEKFNDNQLAECPLTLRDLTLIKESFVNMLTGIYHARIEYPEQEKKFFQKEARLAKETTAV